MGRAHIFSVLLLLFPSYVWSHALAPSLFQITETENGLELFWKTPTKSKSLPLSPRLPEICQLDENPAELENDRFYSLHAVLDCDKASLVGESLSVHNIHDTRTSILVRYVFRNGAISSAFINAVEREFSVPGPMSQLDVWKSYLFLGVDHLVFGFDHVLFVICLVLVIRSRRALIWAITSFTVGHSVTLALASLGLVNIPQQIIEIFIAASIVMLAMEAVRGGDSPSVYERYPGVIPAAFGLLHGLGFAGALIETGLPQNELPLALFAFNVGIEIGQLLIVAVFLLMQSLAKRLLAPRLEERMAYCYTLGVYLIGGIAAFWVIERVIGVIA